MDPNNINNPVGNPQPVPPVFPVTPPDVPVSDVPSPSVVNMAPQGFDSTLAKPKHKVWKWVGILAGVFVAIGVLIFVLVFALTAAPVKVANEQFNDIRQNNLQAAYDLFSDPAKGQTSFTDFQSMVSSNHLSDAQAASINFSGRQVNGDNAELDGKITVNATSAGLKYILVKENGVWKVSGFDIIPQ